MKKIFCLFAIFTLALTSCSNDDESSSVFVKKIIEKEENGDELIKEYAYDENRIATITVTNPQTDGTYKINYSYTDGLISSVLQDTLGRPRVLTTFTYNGNYLKTKLVTEFVNAAKKNITKTYYTYNMDNSFSYKEVDVDENNNAESNPRTGKLTFENDKLTKEEFVNGSSTISIAYEYDVQNNPFKNIKGAAYLLGNVEIDGSKYNRVKETLAVSSSNSIYTSAYTYDKKGFPTEAKHFNKDGGSVGSKLYFY